MSKIIQYLLKSKELISIMVVWFIALSIPSRAYAFQMTTLSELIRALFGNRRKITRAMFDDILPGMPYEKAVMIIGRNGKREKGHDGSDTINYKWQNRDQSGMSLCIQNGVVKSKRQWELK